MKIEKEQLDQNFLAYLRKELKNPNVDYAEPLKQLQGGFETQTYRFRLNGADENLSQPLVLRLYPEFYGSENATWESTVQDVLSKAGYPVAKPHLLCEDKAILGGAFFIMDFLPGIQLVNAPLQDVPVLLGKTHARLHQIDPAHLLDALIEHGLKEEWLLAQPRFNAFIERLNEFEFFSEISAWLVENYPQDTVRSVICHGDFHPLNILVDQGKVSAVLDWPGLMIGDPVFDVANTIVLSTIPFKFLAPTLGMDVSALDFDQFAAAYLQVYQSDAPLDTTHLEYFRVRRCAQALMEGLRGQQIWQHPLIRQELIEYINANTGITITLQP